MRKPVVYLAGSIRDGYAVDIVWREWATEAFKDHAVILNPLAGNDYDPETKKWTRFGVEFDAKAFARSIVKQDFWCVDNADILVCNFMSMADKYPSIGTLVEFGRATARGCLIYTIAAGGFTGHQSTHLKFLHPFLEQNSVVIFHDVRECIDFVRDELKAFSGAEPGYGRRS